MSEHYAGEQVMHHRSHPCVAIRLSFTRATLCPRFAIVMRRSGFQLFAQFVSAINNHISIKRAGEETDDGQVLQDVSIRLLLRHGGLTLDGRGLTLLLNFA